MVETHLSITDIAGLKQIEEIYGKPIPAVFKEANRIVAAAGIEFGENELSYQGYYDESCPRTFVDYRWIEVSAVRGSNEGFYIHVRLVSRKPGTSWLIGTAKTWTMASALEISAALTRVLCD